MKLHYSRLISQSISRRLNPKNLTHTHFPKTPKLLQTPTFSTSTEQPKPPSQKVNAIVNELSTLTLLEVSDLTEVLRKKLGIDEMPVMAVMMPGMAFGGGGMKGRGGAAVGKDVEEKKEKTAFDLKLEGGFEAGVKIKIIKEVRTFTDLGLKEAKELVEKAPTLLKKGVTKEEAEKIIAKMKEIGAKVSME